MAIEQQPRAKSGSGSGGGSGGADASLQRTRNFLQEVLVELKKTTWPTRQEANRLTLVVIVVIAVLGAYMGILDFLLSTIVAKFQIIK
ncbi:MAG TPA: preprotein translocase subunit SecE [Chthonomonadaceae bacterium]|nr:preprotein translocase subunit SecE [Chthonomonadaceae bacterium]